MEVRDLDSINDLEREIENLRKLIKDSKRNEYQLLSKTLFRGQRNAEWDLETTLERYSEKAYFVEEFNETLWAIAPATTSFTGKDWIFDREISLSDTYFSCPPNYEFMSYTRHHGFPSPLLDWSQSMYVALFFAFQNAKASDRVAIFCYVESLSSGKSGWVGAPQICELGPYVKSHQRHFTQQAQYTVAVKKKDKKWVYCPHKEAFDESKGLEQDLLYKFTLPGSLRDDVLTKLHEMNINAFTLYSTEESLMEMLAYKEISMRNI